MKTFKIGGVHPSENKLSAKSPIRQAGLPRQAVISLYQHIGAPAKPVVAKGDEVKVGMLTFICFRKSEQDRRNSGRKRLSPSCHFH